MRLNSDVLAHVNFLVGSADTVSEMVNTPALIPFSEEVINFLNDLSKMLMTNREGREYSDVVTFAFWIRKASLLNLKERFTGNISEGSRCSTECSKEFRLGRGLVFHIAPSNVPVNFAYSLVSSLLCGNSNIVRVPSKHFPQVEIITNAINTVLASHQELQELKDYQKLKKYIVCCRYEHDKEVNDLFSSICDVRIIWGGDRTIEALRQSPLQARSTEITFADRYSVAVIDATAYLAIGDKDRVAQDFYNDTYFSDQNACTSPRVVIWIAGSTGNAENVTSTGNAGNTENAETDDTAETDRIAGSTAVNQVVKEAQSLFWQYLHKLVKEKYKLQAVQAVDKLTRAYIDAVNIIDTSNAEKRTAVKIETQFDDNLITRVAVADLSAMINDDVLNNFNNNSGYFYEYICKGSKGSTESTESTGSKTNNDFLTALRPLFNDKRCQTVSYIGKPEMFDVLLESGSGGSSGIKGIDRIVPVGQTMDFDLIWDGYDLSRELTRVVTKI